MFSWERKRAYFLLSHFNILSCIMFRLKGNRDWMKATLRKSFSKVYFFIWIKIKRLNYQFRLCRYFILSVTIIQGLVIEWRESIWLRCFTRYKPVKKIVKLTTSLFDEPWPHMCVSLILGFFFNCLNNSLVWKIRKWRNSEFKKCYNNLFYFIFWPIQNKFGLFDNLI